MGRYYSGDIEGKFWFGVQPSDDAEFYGATANEPCCINYSFSTADLPKVEEGIKTCLAQLGDRKAQLDTFFSAHNGYNDKSLTEYLGVPESEVGKVLEWYARLELGEKIKKSLEETGQCCFDAEL